MKYLILFLFIFIGIDCATAQHQQGDIRIDPDQSSNIQYIGVSSNGRDILSNKKHKYARYETKGHYHGVKLIDVAEAIGEFLDVVSEQQLSDSLATVSGGGGDSVIFMYITQLVDFLTEIDSVMVNTTGYNAFSISREDVGFYKLTITGATLSKYDWHCEATSELGAALSKPVLYAGVDEGGNTITVYSFDLAGNAVDAGDFLIRLTKY